MISAKEASTLSKKKLEERIEKEYKLLIEPGFNSLRKTWDYPLACFFTEFSLVRH